jgi:hypothetical protein
MKRNCETPKTRPFSSFDKQRYSFNSTRPENNSKLVTALRNRTTPVEVQLNSEVASKVVRQYILPLFNQDCREKSLEKRRKSIGLKHHKKVFSNYDGTFYSELKLSDQLSQDMKTLAEKLENTQQLYKENKQKLFTVESELKKTQEDLLDQQSLTKALLLNNMALEHYKNLHLDPQTSLTQQVIVYKALISQLFKEKEDLSKHLQEEKAINDIRFFLKFSLTL